MASALVNTAQQVGGSLGTALLNTIATSTASAYVIAHTVRFPSAELVAAGVVHGYAVVFAVSGALLLVASATTAVLVRPGSARTGPVRTG